MGPLAAAADLLAPPRCLACGAAGRQPWCASCQDGVVRLRVRRVCGRCGGASAGRHPCWREPAAVAGTVVALRYLGPVAAAIVAAKARGAWRSWRAFGVVLAGAVADAGVAVDVVTWVPADRARVRDRGVDHAALLAAPVARRLEVPRASLLRARSGRPDQTRLDDAARRGLSGDAFVARVRLDGARVLLVDDVLTTGATARVAASALRNAGAAEVHLAAFARAGAHELG